MHCHKTLTDAWQNQASKSPRLKTIKHIKNWIPQTNITLCQVPAPLKWHPYGPFAVIGLYQALTNINFEGTEKTINNEQTISIISIST